MSQTKRASATPHGPTTTAPDEPASVLPLKVYFGAQDKAAFEAEAETHGQRASAYARFILQARADPLLFLQLCRLRDPEFAKGMMGNPQDAGRVSELEKRVLQLEAEAGDLRRDRDDAEKRAEEAERRLCETTERQSALAGYVVDLARAQEKNRERAYASGAEYEEVPKATLAIIKTLSLAVKLTRKELEARVAAEGMTPQEAAEAVATAADVGLIEKTRDARYRLAAQPTPEEASA